MSTLSKNEIIDRLKPSHSQQLHVTPIWDLKTQISSCGIDLRLGKQFIVFNEHLNDSFDPVEKTSQEKIYRYQREVVVPIKEYIILHPGKLIIAGTLEYVAIPNDMQCQVEGRSSWARLGLVIATATTIEPNFKGIITLELSNIGKIPIKLYPGVRIAQLLCYTLSSPVLPEVDYIKKYECNIGPVISKLASDDDFEYLSGRLDSISDS